MFPGIFHPLFVTPYRVKCFKHKSIKTTPYVYFILNTKSVTEQRIVIWRFCFLIRSFCVIDWNDLCGVLLTKYFHLLMFSTILNYIKICFYLPLILNFIVVCFQDLNMHNLVYITILMVRILFFYRCFSQYLTEVMTE